MLNHEVPQKNQPIASRGAVTVRGFVLQEWQRLPAQLLQQHCQKEKRPRFLFRKAAASAAEPDRARARVVLPDAKNDAKTLSFCPQEAFETVEVDALSCISFISNQFIVKSIVRILDYFFFRIFIKPYDMTTIFFPVLNGGPV